MKRAYIKRLITLFTAALAMIVVLGSFTTDRYQSIDDQQTPGINDQQTPGINDQKTPGTNDQQVPASVQKRDAMLDILESLEENRPYRRSENWGAPRAFPPKIYLPPVSWHEDYEFNFDFSFAEEMIENTGERIENIDFEKIERDLEQLGRKIEKGIEKAIKDIERKSTCKKNGL